MSSDPAAPAPRAFEAVEPGAEALAPVGDDLAVARRHLEAAALVGPEQEAVRREVLAFADRHPDCLHRSCLVGHLTGSAFVVDPASGRALLIHHAKLGRWLQPGGHADGEGNLGLVAWTEATEETGLDGLVLVTPALDLDIHPIPARPAAGPGRPAEPEHRHLDLRFLVLATGSGRLAPNHETLGARWVEPDDPAVAASGELSRGVARAVAVARSLAG